MHNAKLENSERLQRVLRFLSDGRPRSTREIIHGAGVCAVNSIISELRANGLEITCRCADGRQGIYEYILVSPPLPVHPGLEPGQAIREGHPSPGREGIS